ncbi:carbohydrate-binding module family 14 protein [Pseudomonas sp. PWP3-1]|uniref:carbohydrate-binding module family 14 protein n=1 Tax=unclassified Pseudomonas TaxID=196821 RepID=UPI003CEB1F6D
MHHFISKKVMRTVPKVVLATGVAVLLAACSTGPSETVSSEYPGLDPACTSAGYFKSISPGWYYRCVWNGSINRWIKYPNQCPAGQEFDVALKRCVPKQ